MAETPDEKPAGTTPSLELTTSTLFKSRTIALFGEITDRLARDVVAQLLALANVGSDPIRMFISSPGGHVESGDAVFDVVRFITPRVIMIGTGWVASAGALIYLSAKKADRYCLPNTRFLLHQPMGQAYGSGSDVEIHTREMLKMRRRLNLIIARETGQTLERVERDTDRDCWLTAEEAQQYGIVGSIIDSTNEIQ